jgi:hypothetical protein
MNLKPGINSRKRSWKTGLTQKMYNIGQQQCDQVKKYWEEHQKKWHLQTRRRGGGMKRYKLL